MVVDICGMWGRGPLPTKSEVVQYFSDRYNCTGADPYMPAWAGLHSTGKRNRLRWRAAPSSQCQTPGSRVAPLATRSVKCLSLSWQQPKSWGRSKLTFPEGRLCAESVTSFPLWKLQSLPTLPASTFPPYSPSSPQQPEEAF